MSTILYETNGFVATITLNRPEKFNSFDARMRANLLDAIGQAEGDDRVRIVIIKGSGRGFCAGTDLTEGVDGNMVEDLLENEYKPFLMAIHQGKKIYIAQVHRTAAGIGGALAMTCDFCVIDETANLYLAFAAIGLIPDGGKTWQLLHGMGYSRALQAIIEGRKIPAEECLVLGLVNKVVPLDMLDEVTLEWANELAKGAPLAQRAAKRLLKKVGSVSYGEAISIEAAEQAGLTNSEDCKNAVEAFLNKQKPVFEGK
ncbi:MAG: enoyl-CoA hydratase/isomerase family protein [Hyphomicrobiales bacterium]|nr:enoyl-CoA hydratase/isomerase family protein [Hyphomicrobiales bacterium]